VSEASLIQDRLKEIASEMAALLEANAELTEDQETVYTALEKEADELTVDLEKLRKEGVNSERKAKADAIRTFAKDSSRVTAPNAVGTRIGRIRDNIQDDPKRGFKSFAHFAARVVDAGNQPRGDDMLMQVAAGTGLSQSINSDGGVLVPPAFSRSIWDKAMTKSNSLLSYCDVIPVDAGVESITVPAIAESSRVDGSRQGGIRGYWKSELALMTSSKQTFREVKFTPQELYVFCFISDKLLRNAPGTASKMMEDGSADEISFKIGDAIINGDGLGKPVGVLGHPATVSIAKETGQPAATLAPENISKMWARCHANWRRDAVWFINQDVETALRSLKFEVGSGGVPVFLPPGGLSESPYYTLYGRPLIPIEYCATLGTVGDIILGNLKAYAAAVKGMTDTAYSMHLKFDYAQTAFRVIFEMDGQPWMNTAITPFKGSNSTSPIVTLATRS
jgi:HK97 family phage major capsid protein